MIKHLEKEEDFYEIIKEGPIIVDFYADWCGPCKMLLPVLDEIDFATILKVNVDEFPDIAKRFGIMSIPTMILFVNGEQKEKQVGLMMQKDIEDMIKKYL